jgi:hypothetical protein
MFRGFFDESNKSASRTHFVMAGWLATVEEWERFSEAWDACLLQTPLRGQPFHSRGEEFRKLHVSDRDRAKLSLAKVISKHDVRGYIATVKHEVFSNKPEELRKMMATRIYDWAFMAIIPSVLFDHLERGERSRIDFVFDGCSELRACIESYERRRQEWTPSMQATAGTVIPGEDEKLTGLQAADLLSGEHSIFLNTGTRKEPYIELENSRLPIKVVEACPPLSLLDALHQYAHEVFARDELKREFVELLKENGLTVNELKAKLDDLEKQ